MMKVKRRKAALWVSVVCVFGLVCGLAACAPNADKAGRADQKATDKPIAQKVETTPATDSYGVVDADTWKDYYPNQYATYEENNENGTEGKHDYLKLYPALNTMYKGYAFALGYDEAHGHTYSLETVKNTPRTVKKDQLANCITCKTPQFTAMVNSEGDEVYAKTFKELINDFTEPISCYNCHENDPTQLKVTNKFYLASLGEDVENYAKAPLESQVCGQCHNEYYFDSKTKVPANPYSGTDAMTPDAILAYYDNLKFGDWNHADTMAPMIKVQHPEFETIYGGDSMRMAKIGYTCSDCHMGTQKASDGTMYSSHNWISPLENDELINNDCARCHADLKSEVAGIQAKEEQRVTSISEKIEDMTNRIADKYADEIAQLKETKSAGGTMSPSEGLAKMWKYQRDAQFYWDFVMVENSEGAHNPTLTFDTLDKAENLVDEALALLA